MNSPHIQDIVIEFVDGLPEEYISRVCDFLRNETQFERERILLRLRSAISQAEAREKVRVFIENWEKVGTVLSPVEMALLISSVSTAMKYQRRKQSLELIWSGPESRFVPLRRTDQALIELINTAHGRLTIVSFAVYRAKNILSALEKAAQRGVEISIIVESSESREGKLAFDTISALGAALRSMTKIYIWPSSKRPTTPDGKYGSMHAKIAVSDSEKLYISSANLTAYAMNLNMEMGILVTGSDLPATVQRHFDELISDGVLAEIAAQ